jgi:hypothetical protein
MNRFLSKPADFQHIQALNRCKQEGANGTVQGLFLKTLESIKDKLVIAETATEVQRLQGQANLIIDFLDAIERSTEILEKLRK